MPLLLSADSDGQQNIGLVSEQKIKQLARQLSDYMSSGDSQAILTSIGDMAKISKGVSIVIDVRNWHIARKIKAFVGTLDSQNIDALEHEKLCRKYGKAKILEEVIIRLDRFSDDIHAKIMAYLMSALITDKLTWDRFVALNFCLELINPQDIELYKSETNLGVSFITAGLAYITYNYDGAPQSITPNGNLFNDFNNFGLKPYLDSTKKELA